VKVTFYNVWPMMKVTDIHRIFWWEGPIL